ncbi:MAG: hypothetical protein ACLVD8_26725 [Enterocloster sp.]
MKYRRGVHFSISDPVIRHGKHPAGVGGKNGKAGGDNLGRGGQDVLLKEQ